MSVNANFGNNSYIAPLENSYIPTCATNITTFNANSSVSSCARQSIEQSPNNSVAIIAENTLHIRSKSIDGSFINLCAYDIIIDKSTLITTNGRGCSGSFSSSLAGGKYVTQYSYINGHAVAPVSSGYGGRGNCGTNSYGRKFCYGGSGGGVLVIIAANSTIVNGNLASNGFNGNSDSSGSGGGSGGSVLIKSSHIYGNGLVSAKGGLGYCQGGGGSGGSVQLFVSNDAITFTNLLNISILVIGGTGGPSCSQLTKLRQRKLQQNPPVGLTGSIILPICEEGYGNAYYSSPSSQSNYFNSNGVCNKCYICQRCVTSFYKDAQDNSPCSSCGNAPSTANYCPYYQCDGCINCPGDKSISIASCPYQCIAGGYVTDQCYNQLSYFIYDLLTVAGTIGTSIGLFLLVFGPLFYFRLKKKYGWFENKLEGRDGFFMRNLKSFLYILGLKSFFFPVGKKIKTNNNISRSGNYKEDVRKACRLNDHDLNFHSCRINFLGSNSPFKIRGIFFNVLKIYNRRWSLETVNNTSDDITSDAFTRRV